MADTVLGRVPVKVAKGNEGEALIADKIIRDAEKKKGVLESRPVKLRV